MDILLKLDHKLLLNIFHMSHRSSLCHKKNLRFNQMFASGCWGVLHLVAREVAIDILLKLNCKLLSNTFYMSHRSYLYHKKNLRFSHLHLVAREFCI